MSLHSLGSEKKKTIIACVGYYWLHLTSATKDELKKNLLVSKQK